MGRRALIVVASLLAACGDDPPASELADPGEIIGRVEVSEDVPASQCHVLLDGTPLAAPCDGTGAFDVIGVFPGALDLTVYDDNPITQLAPRRLAVASNSGFVTDLGAIRLAQPGSIGGRVIGGAPDGIIVIPSYGIVTAPNPNGGYLLKGVPPGTHDVVLITDDGTSAHPGVQVLPGITTVQVDLDIGGAVAVDTTIDGKALRAGSGNHGGLDVELLDASTGEVVAATESASDGAFLLEAHSGIFVLRARDGDSPITAIVPSIVPQGTIPLHLASPLIVYAQGGDLDHDGLDDDEDGDIDNDGVENDEDAFPYDPAETQDVDGDGLGDRADLATQGDDLDTQNPTDDEDEDGLLDFEDNCPMVANADQDDSDDDGDGDVCDNCRFDPNPEQEDAVGDGIGDACRLCNGSEECPTGLICSQGRCVDCTADSQCGGEVCRGGACVPCTLTETCAGELVCNEPLGFCQDCLVNLDCDAGSACVAGHCFAGCNLDADCGGAYCVDHACVACRDAGDCGGTEWCDAGLCQPQCTTDANCSGGRVCDLDTRTCVLPCDAGCPSGQLCDANNVCREVCDGSFPCPPGLECNLTNNQCEPECMLTADCSGFDVCQAGSCVPSGDCALDTDCALGEMCSVVGSCISRPTSFDTAAGAYTCSGACDCKLGETCDGTGHCVPDGVPNRYVQQGATGNGLSITTPSGNFRNTSTGLPTGASVAVRAGQTFASDGAPIAITSPDVKVRGGYVLCSTTRWVRDAGQTTTLTNANANFGFFAVNGNFAVPAADVDLGGFTMDHASPTGSYVQVDAIYAPRLHVHDLVVTESNTTGALTAVDILNSPDVVVEDISATSLIGAGGNTHFTMVTMAVSSGVVRQITVGPIFDAWDFHGVSVSAATGPVLIEDVTAGQMTVWADSASVLVSDTSSFPITVRNVASGAMAASVFGSSGFATVVHVNDSGNVAVSGVTVDGTGFIDPRPTPDLDGVIGVWFENSNGTVSDSHIAFARVTSADYADGYAITGPAGNVTLTDCATSGDGGPMTRLVDIADVTTGTVTIDDGSFTLSDSGPTSATGLLVDNAYAVVTDSTFQLSGAAADEYGFLLAGGANARIERSQFLPGGRAGVTSLTIGGRLYVSATLELYDSWLRGGATATGHSTGLWFDGDVDVRAIGNTLEGGGASNQAGASVGVRCEEGGGTPTALFASNVVDGGRAANHFMVQDVDDADGACSSSSSWSRSYFGFRAAGVQWPGSVEDADVISGANSNILGNAATCFDTAFPNDFRIAAASLCINAGIAGTRADATPLTLDLLGGPRVLGAAADIGAQEKQ